MKFTLSWLKEHLETDATLDRIVDCLTMIGLEVEGVEDKAKEFSAFTVGSVISAQKHPNADKLRVCLVDVGSSAPVQVVCGAPNARAGMKGVFAPPGTHIPGTGIDLKIAAKVGVSESATFKFLTGLTKPPKPKPIPQPKPPSLPSHSRQLSSHR